VPASIPRAPLLVVGLLMVAACAEPRFHGTAYEPPEPAPAFSLVDHRGQPNSLADHRGSTVLLFFGFTACPDICPLTLHRLERALDGLSNAERARILLVTVDPERDTPELLDRYLEAFPGPITGLTGAPDELERIRAAYGVYAGAGADPGTLVHSTSVFGIDRRGNLRVLLRGDMPEEQLREDLRTLLTL
jgi:protein SCO1